MVTKESLEALSTGALYVIIQHCISIIIDRKTKEKSSMKPEHNPLYGAITNEIGTLSRMSKEIALFSN
jgi:hypothetical protein